MKYLPVTDEEIEYLEALLRRLQGCGEAAIDDGSDLSQEILDNLEPLE